MDPLPIAMVGLNFALWANAMNLLGIGAGPTEEGAPDPTKTVGVAGSLIGAITLVFASIWYVIGRPFGADAVEVTGILSATTGMYGLLWIGVFAAQVRGWDLRPVGNLCVLLLGLQIILMIAFARTVGLTSLHAWLVEAVLLSYVILLYLFRQLTFGKVGARPVGLWLIVTVIGTTYLMFWGGAIFPPPVG